MMVISILLRHDDAATGTRDNILFFSLQNKTVIWQFHVQENHEKAR
jgi:hypothetical protein